MTTNHPTKLDEALVRPGRADVRSEFGYPSRANVKEFFLHFYGRQPAANQPTDQDLGRLVRTLVERFDIEPFSDFSAK